MYGKMKEHLSNTLAEIKEAGLYKEERLIESAQQAAGRMVVVLQHQFFHLAQRVGSGFGHMLGDVGDLCPRDKTVLIA